MQLHQRRIDIDLDAYFQRIGYSGERSPTLTTLQAIHQQHTHTIAFENLNPLLKHPVALDLTSLQEKLIYQGRGGYCFEQNLLLRSVLLALGFSVTNLAARVVWNLPEGVMTPRSHMLLQVDIDGDEYIADVGFGGITLTTPLAIALDLAQPTTHEPFRLIAKNQLYTLQVFIQQEWKSLYKFDLQEQQLPDYEVSNWYVSTHPNSLFVNNLVAAKPNGGCRYTLRNNQFTVHYLNDRTERRVLSTVAELRTTLEDVFGINLAATTLANGNTAHDLDRVLQWVMNQPI